MTDTDAQAWLSWEWERCVPMLARVIHDSGVSVESVWRQICDGQAQFWPSVEAAAVTRLEGDPGDLACVVWLAGGRGLAALRDREPPMTEWAKRMGCNRMEIYGRKGWARLLRGYHLVATEPNGAVHLMKEI